MYREYLPSQALRRYVECYCTRGAGPMPVLPDGSVDILFPEGEAPYVVGTMNRALFIPRGDIGPTVAVRFRPGGAYPLMPLPMQELTDDRVDLKDVWRRATSGESVQAHSSKYLRTGSTASRHIGPPTVVFKSTRP